MGRERTNKHQLRRGSEDKKQNRYLNEKQTGRDRSIFDQNEEALGDSFVFGRHTTVEVLQQGRGNKLFLQEDSRGERVEELEEIIREQTIPVKWVLKQRLETLSDHGVHRGVILAITPYEYLSLDQLIERAEEKKEDPFFLILDSIEDPHSFGSILRTANASNVDGVIIPKHRTAGITPIVTKTSTDAVEYVPVTRVTNLIRAVQQPKETGFWVFDTDMIGTDFQKRSAKGSTALAIGNEGKGMSSGLKKEMDELLTIPMIGHIQSLSASVTAGLLIHQAFSQRRGE